MYSCGRLRKGKVATCQNLDFDEKKIQVLHRMCSKAKSMNFSVLFTLQSRVLIIEFEFLTRIEKLSLT